MHIIDRGQGSPVLLIPGVQGRWEWMADAIDALARHHRVISYSLADEPSSGFPCVEADGFGNYLRQAHAVLDATGLSRVAVVGVSYGGLIASELAARSPERVTHLVISSSPPPDWVPPRHVQRALRAPYLTGALFMVTAPLRLLPELRAALPSGTALAGFIASHLARILRAPMSPSRAARRMRWMRAHAFADQRTITAPTLIVTGEPGADRVVPVEDTRRMATRIAGARCEVLPRTGHVGLETRPEAYAELVHRFLSTTPAA